MKTFAKIGFILSLIFLVLGLGSVIASLALGATWQTFMRAVDQGDFLIVANNGFSQGLSTKKISPAQKESSRNYYSDVENLDIQLGKGILNIQETDEDEISVEILSDSSHSVQVELDDGTLKISGAKKHSQNNTEVRLYIPEDEYFDEASFNVGAATVNVENLEADELEVNLGAGIFTGTGEILSETSKWEIGVGELSLEYLDCEDTQIECGMGTVTVTMSNSQEDYDCQVECSAGAVTIGDDSFSMGRHSRSGDDADSEINIKCGMGTVDLLFSNDD